MVETSGEQFSPPDWVTAPKVSCYCDEERHFGHIVAVGELWLAFDATHVADDGAGVRMVGTFHGERDARMAVEGSVARGRRGTCFLTATAVMQRPKPSRWLRQKAAGQ